jgi:very-short-patch-repair endonuclease
MKFGSKLEEKFSKILIEAKIKWVMQYKLHRKLYDFFLPDYKTLIEIDGNFIHSNEKAGFIISKPFLRKIYKNDALKNVLAEQAGLRLIRIWEEDLKTLTAEQLKELLK